MGCVEAGPMSARGPQAAGSSGRVEWQGERRPSQASGRAIQPEMIKLTIVADRPEPNLRVEVV
jgi:hypothetical protein